MTCLNSHACPCDPHYFLVGFTSRASEMSARAPACETQMSHESRTIFEPGCRYVSTAALPFAFGSSGCGFGVCQSSWLQYLLNELND